MVSQVQSSNMAPLGLFGFGWTTALLRSASYPFQLCHSCTELLNIVKGHLMHKICESILDTVLCLIIVCLRCRSMLNTSKIDPGAASLGAPLQALHFTTRPHVF